MTAELFGCGGAFARTRAQTLKLDLFCAKLRDDSLKSFQHELGLIAPAPARCGRERRALGFVNELAVGS